MTTTEQKQRRDNYAEKLYQTEKEGFLIVDMADGWKVLGMGDTLEEAHEHARRGDGDELCAYCDCGRDERSWFAYKVHPHALYLVRDICGDRSLRAERLCWDADRAHFRYAREPDCEACVYGKTKELDERGGTRSVECEVCHGIGYLDDPEEHAASPSWYVAPPAPPLGSVWQGARSRCVEQRIADDKRHARKVAAL